MNPDMRPRVLVLATTFPRWVGDSEPAFVWDLTRRLSERGYLCTVLAPHALGAETEEEWEGVRILRFRYAPDLLETVCYEGGALPKLRASWRARLALPGLLIAQRNAIRRFVRSGEFDLVHSHWIIPQGFFAADACRRAGIPLLLTAHAGDVFGLSGPLRWAAASALRSASAITANSRATSAAVQAIHPPSEPILIPMGVDLSRFSKHPPGGTARLEGNPKLLAVGRFAEKKGFQVLIEAMPGLLKLLPEARLHLVGFGPWEDRLRSRIASLGLEGCVLIHGAIPHSRVSDFFRGADLFVQPSIADEGGDREGLGVTLLEAMASGVPVVASRSGGIVDVLEDSVYGLLVEPGNPAALVKGLHALWTSPDRERMAEAARARVAERFSWDSVADRFAGLYTRLLPPKSAH